MIVLFFAGLLLVPFERQPEQAYRAYLPVIVTPPTYNNVGIAWHRGGQSGAADAQLIGAINGYFNSDTWAALPSDTGAVQIIWGMRKDVDFSHIADMQCGEFIIGPNEPDRPDQANLTPAETAAYLVMMSHVCPDSTIVWWNGIWLGHLDASLTAVDGMGVHIDGLTVGIHLYSLWPDDDPNGRIDEACEILAAHGYECNLWVTEVGVCNEWPGAYYIAQDWLQQTGDNQHVERIFWYTSSSGGYPTPCNYDLIDNGELTIVGRAIRDAQNGHFPSRNLSISEIYD